MKRLLAGLAACALFACGMDRVEAVGPADAVATIADASAARTWTPIDLGYEVGSLGSYALGISRSGVITGQSYAPNVLPLSWVQRPGKQKRALLPLPGDSGAYPSGVSDAGIVSGTSQTGSFGPYRPVFWMGSNIAQPVPGITGGQTYHVSENGIVVGDSYSPQYMGFRYRPGGVVEFLHPDTSYPFTHAYSINNAGYAAGESNGPVIWTPGGSVMRIPAPPGYYGGAARYINNNGDVVGYFTSATVTWNAFVKYKGQPVQFLQPPLGLDVTFAFAIDKYGAVFGWAAPNQPGATYLDYIWVGGVPSRLPQHPILGGYAVDANECGALVGSGHDGGVYHVMKWTTSC